MLESELAARPAVLVDILTALETSNLLQLLGKGLVALNITMDDSSHDAGKLRHLYISVALTQLQKRQTQNTLQGLDRFSKPSPKWLQRIPSAPVLKITYLIGLELTDISGCANV